MKPHFLNIHSRPLTLVKFNHHGDFFITCGKDGEVNLIRTETCELVGTYALRGGDKLGAVYAVDITMDNKYVVVAGSDGKLAYFTFEGEQIQLVEHKGIVKFVEFNQKYGEQNLVCTCSDKFAGSGSGQVPNRIMIWQFQPVAKILTIQGDKLPMRASKVKWGPFDETLISIDDEGTIRTWCTKTGEPLGEVSGHRGQITSLNFTEDRSLMITSSKDCTCKLWAMDGNEPELLKVYEVDRPCNDAAISPLYKLDKDPKHHILLGGGQDAKDVTTTAASSGKFEVCLWHMIFEEEIGTIKGGFGPMNCIAWMCDGRGFVTGGEDGYVRVYHLDQEYFTKKAFECEAPRLDEEDGEEEADEEDDEEAN